MVRWVEKNEEEQEDEKSQDFWLSGNVALILGVTDGVSINPNYNYNKPLSPLPFALFFTAKTP